MPELKSDVAHEQAEDARANVDVVDAFSPEALDATDALYLTSIGAPGEFSKEAASVEVTLEFTEYDGTRGPKDSNIKKDFVVPTDWNINVSEIVEPTEAQATRGHTNCVDIAGNPGFFETRENQVPSDSAKLEAQAIADAINTPRSNKKSKYKKQKQKRPAASAVAAPNVLKEFVEQGINGQGLSTVKTRITYKIIDEFSDIRRQMSKPQSDAGSIQVLTHAHNCIHAANGFSRSIFREVANLSSADHETQKTSYKLGKFSVAAYNVRGQESKLFVHSLYVQFCLGIPNRGAPENNMHVVPRAVRAGLRSIFKMHTESNHGLVIFGDDTHYPTDWSIIETQIEEICEQLDRTITIFVPRSYVASCKQKLDGRLAPFLRKAGMLI